MATLAWHVFPHRKRLLCPRPAWAWHRPPDPFFLSLAGSTEIAANVHRIGGRVGVFGITLNLDLDCVDYHTAELSAVAWRFDCVGHCPSSVRDRQSWNVGKPGNWLRRVGCLISPRAWRSLRGFSAAAEAGRKQVRLLFPLLRGRICRVARWVKNPRLPGQPPAMPLGHFPCRRCFWDWA